MLGKLIKYDFRSVSKVMWLLVLVMGGYSLLAAIMLQTPIYADIFLGGDVSDGMTVFGGISGIFGVIAFFVLVVSIPLAAKIYLGVRFFQSMYEDEGYLTHTLPATTKERLGAKMINATLWMFIIKLVIALSFGFILISLLILGIRNGLKLSEMIDEITETLENMFFYGEYVDMFLKATVHGIIYGIFYILLSPFADVAHVFGALSIGQNFKKNRGFIGVVMYFAIKWGTSFILMIVRGVVQVVALGNITVQDAETVAGYINRTIFLNYDLQLIVTTIIGVVLTMMAHNIIDKKLNLI